MAALFIEYQLDVNIGLRPERVTTFGFSIESKGDLVLYLVNMIR